jgi:hypothetical protein
MMRRGLQFGSFGEAAELLALGGNGAQVRRNSAREGRKLEGNTLATEPDSGLLYEEGLRDEGRIHMRQQSERRKAKHGGSRRAVTYRS